MFAKGFCYFGIACAAVLAAPVGARAVDLTVVAVDPPRHALTASVHPAIRVEFDQPVKPETIVPLRSFWAFGRWSGTVTGTFEFSNANRTVTLRPDHALSAGETVMVILSHDIEGADGSHLRAGGYSWQFWTRTAPTDMQFEEVQRLNVRSDPQIRVRAYGGFASDVNGDRFLDLSIVNEDFADLRVMLNRADGSGTFHPYLVPPSPMGDRVSPNEPSDFNRDGIVDVCACNINDNTVSILLGNGDGTFAPQQIVSVGIAPRGVVVLDVDGDGDVDIVNTNAGDPLNPGNMSLALNDGTGVFGPATTFEGGGAKEWALAAADMNDDGMLDLVIGSQSDQLILVQTANGDGTFTPVSSQSADGAVWMLVCGDVDGDGTEDVAVVNSSNNRAAILLGDGAGQLAPPQRYSTDSFPLATDLGDLDGDGDLDWVTSSFGGDWFLFENIGGGAFQFRQEFLAPEDGAASCALMLDIDNDRDLDLALIDELGDDIIVMSNIGGTVIPAASAWSLVAFLLALVIAGSVVMMTARNRTVQ